MKVLNWSVFQGQILFDSIQRHFYGTYKVTCNGSQIKIAHVTTKTVFVLLILSAGLFDVCCNGRGCHWSTIVKGHYFDSLIAQLWIGFFDQRLLVIWNSLTDNNSLSEAENGHRVESKMKRALLRPQS